MSFLKKISEKTDRTPKKIENSKTPDNPKVKVKKKTKIGFGSKNKVKRKEQTVQKTETEDKIKSEEVKTVKKQTNEISPPDILDEDLTKDEREVVEEDLEPEQKQETSKIETDKQWSKNKKKKLLAKDMKGKPVYLEDTGEKLGTVFDMMYDADNNHIGYKIKDKRTDSVLSFPIEQFDVAKDGLIFIQGWYTTAIKTIEQLEFKENVSPELTTLISDDAISNEELYNIFVKHDDQMANYIEDAIALKKLLKQRLDVLERQRLALKDDLMNLTEKRLIKDIDRREFSEDVIKHRKKVNVLDVNITKCKDLLNRLDKTSFGKLSLPISKNIEKTELVEKAPKNTPSNLPSLEKENNNIIFNEEIENPYKLKYDNIKQRFDQLQDEYNELKSAVEKLIAKDNI